MVLSNKKLKQRLRAELAESSAKSQPGINSNIDSPTNPDSNSEPHCSLKVLLDSASRKPRLSKREKRRKARPFQEGGDASIGDENKDDEGTKENGSEGLGKQKKDKKRKRKIKDEDKENGEVKGTKKSKKKDRKKQKRAKAEQENSANPKGEMPEVVGLKKSRSR